jgi:hypothetical protein
MFSGEGTRTALQRNRSKVTLCWIKVKKHKTRLHATKSEGEKKALGYAKR